jgi:hypothetical protein
LAKKRERLDPPFDTLELRRGLKAFLDQPLAQFVDDPPTTKSGNSITVGAVKWGVYGFFDYDGEPIYVGQTRESLGTRIRRHLTNQRTDAVAMSVLDPMEVRTIKVWPLPEYQPIKKASGKPWNDAVTHLNGLERRVFEELVEASEFKRILNEKDPPPANPCDAPRPIEGQIVSSEVLKLRGHPDTRVARRSQIIARLAQVISERELKTTGLRRALVTQAQRLASLSDAQYQAHGGQAFVKQRSRDEREDVSKDTEL